MLKKIIDFIKYNNAAVVILAVVLIVGGGAFAAGPEAIGQKETTVQGLDNTLLLQTDLAQFNMDFKIENINQDEAYYYVTYSFMDLAVVDSAWQYQLSQRTQKVSKKIKQDIGLYMAKFLAKHYEARLRELTAEKSREESLGAQSRVAVTEYSGLVGRTLDIAAKIFPGYEAVVKVELPAPDLTASLAAAQTDPATGAAAPADSLTKIYTDYVAAHPEVFIPPIDSLIADASSTPAVEISDPLGIATTTTATTTPSDPTDVQVIDLPAGEAGQPPAVEPDLKPLLEPAPTLESTPEPTPTPEPAQ